MADTDKDNKEEQQASAQEAVNVANLSVPTIIAALHENAVNKSNAASKGVKVVNSAVDNESGKASLKSAGEHIVSVLPLKPETPIEKQVAVDVLKAYVQWFVGPDLAKKVDASTVKSLLESPKGESVHVVSFKQFLQEADEESSPPDLTDAKSVDAEEGKEEGKEKTEDGDKKDDQKNKEDEKSTEEDSKSGDADKSKAGYYIPYSLKVEGLPQTALKDSMKKFAKTFFDDVKFTASGLFGGNASFTVKDAKDALRNAFGPIDPDKLVQNIRTRLEKKFPGSDPIRDIKVQDSQTLIKNVGDFIDGKQKQKIQSAENALYISIDKDDPKVDILNPRIMADIVTASISGLFKKFKNKITKDDVIYIKDFKDIHKETDAIRKLYHTVPTIDELAKIINKASDANAAFADIEGKLNKIQKDTNRKNCKRADECVKVWEKWYNIWKENGDTDDIRSTKRGNEKNKYFQKFKDDYKKAFDSTVDKELFENTTIKFKASNHSIFVMLMESLFTEADDAPDFSDAKSVDDEEGKEDTSGSGEKSNEDSSSTDSSSTKLDATQIKQITIDAFKRKIKNAQLKVKVGSKDDLLKSLSKYDIDDVASRFGDYKNGIAVDFGEMMQESIKSSIMSILFEDEPSSSKPTIEQVKDAFDLVCRKVGIEKYGEVIDIWYDSSDKYSSKSSQSGQKKADSSKESLNEADASESKALNKLLGAFDKAIVAIGHGTDENGKQKEGPSITPICFVGTSSDVLAWLEARNLATGDAKQELEESKYAAVNILKIPAKLDDSGKLKGGSPGFKNYTSKNILNSFNSLLTTKIDKPVLEFEATANEKITYYFNKKKSKIPAKCKVRMMFFNDLALTGGDDPQPKPSEDGRPDAYVLPFGDDVEAPKPVDTSKDQDDIDADDSYSHNDLYIIPMPKLKYTDPEYETTNL